MGFDNECIVNIHSLAGEYFCPVCRTLVYPNEALQSQCTHLYCKPCLAYVVGTTKACPYDGYLVTEEHSKPLVESDKALAEKIDKTLVHCLFHRSGCSWQGPLSQCTAHCSGCSFGNSPVVCNRCGIQIVHRQVQEHAQNCAGANPQAQQTAENPKDPATSVTASTANSSQPSSQLVAQASQAPVSQIATAPPSTNPQVQANTSATGTTAEQWYPQQFQQYYQQYPAYDPYQQSYQQYYPYQQQTAQPLPQHVPHVGGQPQVYPQHQTAIQPHHQPLHQVQGQSQAHIQPQLLAQQPPPSQHQLQIPPQGPYVQNQGNPQQSNLVTQPQPQIQPHTQPAAQGQIPSQQPYPQVQLHPLTHSMQPPAQQNFQAPPNQQAHAQGHLGQLQMQPQPHSQPQSHPHLPPLQPNNIQSQQLAPNVVPAYQSHPPVQPHPQLMQAPPQYPMHMHPQQSSQMPSQQVNVSVMNQPQSNLMPSQNQMQGVPPAQLQQFRPQAPQQGHSGQQRPAAQSMQQPLQPYGQQAFPLQASGSVRGPVHQLPFAQQPMPVQSRPQGPNQLLQQSAVVHPAPPPHNSAQAHGMALHQPRTHVGRPVAPNQSTASHPFPQSGGAFGANAQSRPIPSSSVQPSEQVPSGQQFSQFGQEVGSSLTSTAGKEVSNAGVDSVGVKVLASETGEKSGNEERRITSEGGNNGTHTGIIGKVEDAEVDALKSGLSEPSMKKDVEEDANGNLDPLSGGNKVETAALGERDGNVVPPTQTEYSSGKDSTSLQTEAYMGHRKDDNNVRTQENKSRHEQVTPQGPAVDEYGRFQGKGFMNSSNSVPFADQGRHKMPPGPYGPSYHQQRPAMPSDLQSGPYPGAPPNALLSVRLQQSSSHDVSFGGHGAPESVHPYESFEGVQRMQHYQNNSTHSQPMFSRTLKAEPTGGSLHGPDGAPMQHNQRHHHFEGRYPEPHASGPFVNESRVPGFDAASGLRVKSVTDGNPLLSGPSGRIGQGEYEDAPKQFPKPSLVGVEPSSNFGSGFSSRAGDYPPHEFNFDTPSRFLPPYHPGGAFNPNDVQERPTGFNEDHRARGFSAHTQPDFHGSGPGFDVDQRPPRSPGREYNSVPSRGFGGISGALHSQSGLNGRDIRAVHEGSRSSDIFSDPVGKPFPEHFRNGGMVGQDFIPNHLHRGELFGPKNGQSHLRMGDGFGPLSDPSSNRPRPGEPGYRSSYSLHGFPSDGGFYAGNNNSFDRFRKRMPTSMGWCRICKVDCETVDGLDHHSQTTEHQRRTMDMVISIKQQNAKRQKNLQDHSSVEGGNRARKGGNRGRGEKA